MPDYCFSGQEFSFPFKLPGMDQFTVALEISAQKEEIVSETLKPVLVSRNTSVISHVNREVEVWSVPPNVLLRVSGGSDFYIMAGGRAIVCTAMPREKMYSTKIHSPRVLSSLDRETLLGPALVLALAMRGTWSLHASAGMYQNKTFAFVGESGRGKSTLAGHLSRVGWRLVVDDILPLTRHPHGLAAWPHFPQLKLPVDQQPSVGLPEQLPLNIICELVAAHSDAMPEVKLLPPEQAIRVLLSHIAGTRLLDQSLLAKHLDFCAKAAGQTRVYRLVYPHRQDALPEIKELLESLC